MRHTFSNDALQGEIALVTGASRGIGAAIAQALAAAGATVIGTATSEDGALGIGAALSSNSLRILEEKPKTRFEFENRINGILLFIQVRQQGFKGGHITRLMEGQ